MGSGEYEVHSHIIHWQNLPVLSEQTAIGRLLVLRDVTQERQLEHMRDDITRAMVHDLRNPLTAVSLSLTILGSELKVDADHRLSQILKGGQNSTERMLNLVNAILDISQLESGRMPVNLEAVSMSELIASTLTTQAALAEEKNIETHSHIAPGILAWADEGLIGRVLQNLVGNALKFTPQDGKILIIASEKSTTSEPRLYVSVQNSGPPIPAELQERLFQKFTTGRQKQRGSGLGLAFCRMALEAHGEQIWLERSDESGTIFTFTLPPPPKPKTSHEAPLMMTA